MISRRPGRVALYLMMEENLMRTHWTRRFSVRLDAHDAQMSATCQCCGDGYLASVLKVLRYMEKHACQKGARCDHDWRDAGHVGPGSERSVCLNCGRTVVMT